MYVARFSLNYDDCRCVACCKRVYVVVEKLKNYMPAQFFCPILYVRFLRGTDIWVGGSNICIPI